MHISEEVTVVLDLEIRIVLCAFLVNSFQSFVVSTWENGAGLGLWDCGIIVPQAGAIPLGQSVIGKSLSGSSDISHVSSWEEVEAVHQNCLASSEWSIIISNFDRN